MPGGFADTRHQRGAHHGLVTHHSAQTATDFELLKQRGGAKVVGLTSARNVAFVEALGFYDQVVTYEAFAAAPIATPFALFANTLKLQLTRSLAAPSDIVLTCDANVPWKASNTSIIALKLAGSSRVDSTG